MPYLTAAQIKTQITALAAGATGLCREIALPSATVSEGIGPTSYSFLKIGFGTGTGRPTILVVAGMHAREWAQPDAVLSFVDKLLRAYQGSTAFVVPAYTDTTGSAFGPVSTPAATVKRMVDTMDILLLPLANPDGRAFTETAPANANWRKNRAPRTVAADPATVGVDLNRNFNIAWDYELYFSAAAAASPRLSASKDAADDRFIGPTAAGPASQPEVKNLVWILDNHPVTSCIDLHSFSMLVMYPWGIEKNGSDATMTFRNAAFDHLRDGELGNAYSEFFPNAAPGRLLDRHKAIVGSMRDGIQAATGRAYIVGGIADTIYPATGSFTDFAFSRQFTVAGSPPVMAFAAEFGDAADNFQPPYSDPHGYPRVEREVHALLLKLLEAALPPVAASPPPPTGTGTGSGGGGKKCFFSMVVDDFVLGPAWLATLREGRAVLLARRWTRVPMLALDRLYRRVGHRLGPHFARRRWARQLIALAIVAPAARITALALRGIPR